jgi:uncharacterized protein
MTLKEFGNSLENTPIWKEGLINAIFGLVPIFLVVIFLVNFWLDRKLQSKFWKRLVYCVSVVLASLLLLGTWGSSFERFNLQVNTQQVKLGFKAKVALFSDIHIGRFKDKTWVDKVIGETNKIENLDAILVAGDWTYYPKVITREAFMESFAGLKNSRYPIYAVNGNHDLEKPGPKMRTEFEAALTELGVRFVDDKSVDFPTWRLVGVEDLWSDNYSGVNKTNFSPTKPNLALTHQPDITRQYKDLIIKPVLTLTGHTHCGQVRIPFLYKYALPTIDAFFDKGWYEVAENSKLFITCGVGEGGLPIRLFNPPVVDVLEIG